MPDTDRYGTRPELLVNGALLRDDVAGLVERVVVDMSVHLADMVEVRFRDAERDVLRRAGLRIGARSRCRAPGPATARRRG
jgi:hypothetical protein